MPYLSRPRSILLLCQGMMWTGGSNPKPAQPLPTATSCFHALPPTIVSVHLEQIELSTEAFSVGLLGGLVGGGALLPNLKHLTMKQCGKEAETIVEQLVASCPKLTRENAKIIGGLPRR
jgi:hypothetical protein